MILFEQLKSLPKIDLHVHFEGSLNTDTIGKILKNKYDSIEIEDKMILSSKNLKDTYNEKYELPIKLTQTKENLDLLMSKLIEELIEDNIIYAEVRVVPAFHTKEGLTQLEVIESLIETTKKYPNIKINFILCTLIDTDEMNNIETFEVAKKLLNKSVVAFDLIGDEKETTHRDFNYLFDLANNYNIPFSLTAKTESTLKKALKHNPKRIGHGIVAIKNEIIKDKIYNENILVEACPSSDLLLNYSEIDNYPIYNLYKDNLKITITSGNRTVFNTNLLNEYCKLVNNFPFSVEDFIEMNVFAINFAYLSQKEKEELKGIFLTKTNQLKND